MKRLADYFVYIVCRLLFAVVQAMPIETARRLSRPFIWFAADALRIRRSVLHDNLQHAFPKLRDQAVARLAREHWEHLFLMIIEIAHAKRKIHLTNWRDHIRFRAKREMLQLLLSDRPTVLLSGHFGNFEVGGQVLGMFGIPTFTIARPLDNPHLDHFINSFRSANGQHILPKKGSSKLAEKFMNNGAALVVLGDQAAGRKGVWAEFFGRPASTHKAIALYSLSYEAPMLVTYTQRLDKPLTFELGCESIADPMLEGDICRDVRHLTMWYTRQLETAIRRAPDQYWWLHRRWKNPDQWWRKKERAA